MVMRCRSMVASIFVALVAAAGFASAPPVDWPTNVKYLERRTHEEWAKSNASAAWFWAGRWIEADAKAIEPHMIRASALMSLEAPAAAIESCDAGLALNPPAGLRLFQLHMLRAGALDAVGEGEAAFNDIRRARLIAATFGDDSAEIRREADKLHWALLARMHSGAASGAQGRRPAVTDEVRLLADMLDVRRVMEAGRIEEACQALRKIAGQDHAPAAAAYQLALLELDRAHYERKFPIESRQAVEWAIARAAKLGYNDALLAFPRRQRIDLERRLTPRKVAPPEESPPPANWFQAKLDRHAAFLISHRERGDEIVKEARQTLRQPAATIERLEKALENKVDAAAWKTSFDDAAASLEALAQLRTKTRDWEREMTDQYDELTAAYEAADESEDQNVREWLARFEKARKELDAVDERTADTLSLMRQEQEVYAIHRLLERLDIRRVTDGLTAQLDDQNGPADVLRITDGLIEIEAMTASLWYRRAAAAKQSDSFHEAFVALAQARIADDAAPAFADLRKWMDDTLAEAALAPERVMRLRGAGHHENALAILRRAVEINSADGAAHLSLASLYVELGATELAGEHAALAWRCHIADPPGVKRLLQVAAQASHWRLLFAASSKLLRDDPLNMDLRHLRAAAAKAIGDDLGANHEIAVMQASGMNHWEGYMWYDVLGFGGFKPDADRAKPVSGKWPEEDFKSEGTPAELRWWVMLREYIAGMDTTARMVRGASPAIKPRADLLAQYLTGKLSEQNYVLQSEAIGAGGYAHFAIGMRRSFRDTDDNTRQHLLRAVLDVSLPILYRSSAQARMSTLWGAPPSRPLTAREPVIVGVDVATLDEAVKIARPGQWIELITAGPHDLSAAPHQSLRIRGAGLLAHVRLIGDEHKQAFRLHELDGVQILGLPSVKINANNGVLSYRRSLLSMGTQVTVTNGALEILSTGTRGQGIAIGAGTAGVIRDSAIACRVDVEGQLLIHRSALAISTEARGKQAIIVGHQVQQSAYQPDQGGYHFHTLKATGGARIHYTDSLVYLPWVGGHIEANAGQIEVDHVICRDDPKLIARNLNAGQVRISAPILSRFVQERVTHEVKTTEEFRAALVKAKPGDLINMVKADYHGPFEIPAGITIQGQGSRLMASITQGKPVAAIKGTGVTTLNSLQITLQSQISAPHRNPNGSTVRIVTPIAPLTGQAFFTALDVPTGNTVLLQGGSLSCSDSDLLHQRPFLRSLQVAQGARVISEGTSHYGNVLLEKGSLMWLNGVQLSAADISGGGSLFVTREHGGMSRKISGAGTTFIAQPPLRDNANVYISGAIDPRESLDLNSRGRIMMLLWKEAQEQLARDMAAAPNDDARYQAIMAYDRKFNKAAELGILGAAERIRQSFETVRPHLRSDALTARVVMNLQGDTETLKTLIAGLSPSAQQAIRTYARAAVDQYNEGLKGGHDAIMQRMSYRHHYPPGSRYHEAAKQAHAQGQPFAHFQALMAAAEKEREQAAARAAEATRQAQLAAARRAEQMRQQQPAPQQPYRSSYTPTWDGSFSKHAMDSWSKLNQQSQQSMNRFYQQQYRQGFRSTPW